MRNAAIAAMTLAFTLGAIGVAQAKAGDPGHPRNKGLCNASEHGNKPKKGQAFVRLAETAGDYDGDGDMDAADVTAYCAENVPAAGN